VVATQAHQFYFTNGNLLTTYTYVVGAGRTVAVNLARDNAIPPGWQGYVHVLSDQPMTGTVLVATPTATPTPTRTSTATATPTRTPTATPTATSVTTSYCVSGKVQDEIRIPLPGVTISDGAGHTTVSNSNGQYVLCGVPTGERTISPSLANYTFTPATRTVTGPPNATGQDFEGRWSGRGALTPDQYYVSIDNPIFVTLSGAPLLHRVQLYSISFKGQLPISTGTVGLDGKFSGSLRMSTPSEVLVLARDLDTGRTLPTRLTLTFSGTGRRPPAVRPIPAITVQVKSSYPLKAGYLSNIGFDFDNKIDVTVDWSNREPGVVEFTLNGQIIAQKTPNSRGIASYTIKMPSRLQVGSNVLQVRAISLTGGGEESPPVSYVIYLQNPPRWLTEGIRAGILTDPRTSGGANAAIEWNFIFPSFAVGPGASDFGLPGTNTSLMMRITGSLKVPLSCDWGAQLNPATSFGDFVYLGQNKGYVVATQEAAGVNSGRGPGCTLLPPQSIWTTTARQRSCNLSCFLKGNYPPSIVTPVWYDLLKRYNTGFASQGPVAAKSGTSKWAMWGKASLEATVKVQAANSEPYWSLRDFNVTGDLSVSSSLLNTNAPSNAATKLSASATGTASFARRGPIAPGMLVDWRWDRLTLFGSAQATFRTTKAAPSGPCQPYQLCILYPGIVTEQVKKPIMWKYGSGPFGASDQPREATAAAGAYLDGGIETAAQPAPFLIAPAAVTQIVAANVFTYTRPSLAANPVTGQALLLWNDVDRAKPALQSTEVIFSRWNGSQWSAAAPLTADTRLDGAPAVAWAGDGKGIAVWPRLDAVLPVTATVDITAARKIELVTAAFNAQAGTWSAPTLLTNNNMRDENVRLARNAAGKLLAVWRQNASGEAAGSPANPDTLMAAIYDAGWGAAGPAVAGIPGLTDLAAGFGQDAATIAFTRELTPTGSLTPTLQLFTAAWNGAAWSAPVQRTDDGLGHRQPQVFYDAANQPLVIWLAGDELRLRNLTTGVVTTVPLSETVGWANELHAAQDADGNIAVVLSAVTEQNDLFLTRYDRALGSWSSLRPLTADLADEHTAAPAFNSAGDLLLGLARTAITEIRVTDTFSDTGEVYTYTVPVIGQTDLLALTHDFGPNLTVAAEDLAISDPQPAPGSSTILTATLRNSGDLPVANARLAFYDGDPAAGGVQIATFVLPAPLAGGASATFTTSVPAPASGPLKRLFAVADPLNALAESDEGDNQASVLAFGPNLELAATNIAYWSEGYVELQTAVRNTGTAPSGDTRLRFYRDAIMTGTLALTDTIPTLAPGEVFTATTMWNAAGLPPGEHLLWVTVNQDAQDFAEAVTSDNRDVFAVWALPNLWISPYHVLTEPAGEDALTVTLTVANTGGVAASGVLLRLTASDPLSGTLLLEETIPAIAAGSYVELTRRVSGLQSDQKEIYIWINPELTVQESSYDDNLVSVTTQSSHTVYLPLIQRK
jgi:hypothetical protein